MTHRPPPLFPDVNSPPSRPFDSVSQKFEVHHIVNGAGRYGLENVAHLDRLPARGFDLIVAPMKVEQGTGGPARIFAIVSEK